MTALPDSDRGPPFSTRQPPLGAAPAAAAGAMGGPNHYYKHHHVRRLNSPTTTSMTATTNSTNATSSSSSQTHPSSKGGWYILAFVLVVVVLAVGIGVACCFCEGCGCNGWLRQQRRRRRRRRRRRQLQPNGSGGEGASRGATDTEGDNDDDDDDSEDDECCVLTIVGRNHPSRRGGSGRNGVVHPSDLRYRQRQQMERQRRKGTRAQRRRKILQSFVRCKVIKVVQACDLIPAEDGTVPRVATRRNDDDAESGREGLAPSPADTAAAAPAAAAGESLGKCQLSTDAGVDSGTDEATTVPLGESVQALAQDVDENDVPVEVTTSDLESGKVSGAGEEVQDPTLNTEEIQNEEEEEEEVEEDEVDDSNGFLQLTPTRRVPNCCAVCLSGYAVGDKVVWSHNRKCRHAFHRDCIVNWFIKMPDDAAAAPATPASNTGASSSSSSAIKTPCPCCRREFTDVEEYRRERRIRWDAQYAFNPSFITFR